jgi:hypothetical protein
MSGSLEGLLDVNRLLATIVAAFGPFDIHMDALAEIYQSIPEDISLSIQQTDDDMIRIEIVPAGDIQE